jgi:hypothetical protein
LKKVRVKSAFSEAARVEKLKSAAREIASIKRIPNCGCLDFM